LIEYSYLYLSRPSNNSISEIPVTLINSSQQWPPPFLLNTNQGPSFPLSITIQPTINTSQPKRHPLRRDSILFEWEHNTERRDSTPWPFRTTNMDFHKQTNEIKKSHLFFNT
jgi:hypothetical protein